MIDCAAAEGWEREVAEAGVAGWQPVVSFLPGERKARVEIYCERRADVERARRRWGGSVRELKEQNWAALGQEPLPDLSIRGKLVVCGARTPEELAAARARHAGREVIGVPAEMAFGTGHHGTTATVLRLLVDVVAEMKGRRWAFADLGCGSGILSVAAVKLGARRAWGCDFDAAAVRISRENARRNGTPEAKFAKVDVLAWEPGEMFEVVAANIFFDILHEGAPQIVRAVKPGGVLMVSGILKTQAEECLARLGACEIEWRKVVTKGKWVTAVGRSEK